MCELLLEIYKDYNADTTKKIAYLVLKDNNFSISTGAIDFYFNGICGKVNLPYTDEENFLHNYFRIFHDERKLIESDKFIISDADYKKCMDYLKKAGDDYDLYDFLLLVYSDHNEDTACKIVTKIMNDAKRNKMFRDFGIIDVMQEPKDYKDILKSMRSGSLGGKYYLKISEVEMSKLPKWAKTFLGPFVDAEWIYHKLVSLMLN